MFVVLLANLNLVAVTSSIPRSPNKYDAKGKKTGQWSMLCDSTMKYVDNFYAARYYRILNYKDGKPIGKIKDYYLTGGLFRVCNLLSDNPDTLNGKFQTFYVNGKKKAEGVYQRGKQIGTWISWFEDGTYGTGSFLDRKYDGLWTFWYQNGKKLKQGNYVNGKEEGKWTSWYSNGYKKEEGEFINGERNGLWKEWGIDYSWAEGTYINGKKANDWKAMAPD
jgi:antitoxin component YwqK of YwqJK toxin-antitoxin module